MDMKRCLGYQLYDDVYHGRKVPGGDGCLNRWPMNLFLSPILLCGQDEEVDRPWFPSNRVSMDLDYVITTLTMVLPFPDGCCLYTARLGQHREGELQPYRCEEV